MTTVVIDNNSRTGRRLLRDIEKHPRIARIVDKRDLMPSPIPDDELISLEEFKKNLEDAVYEDLGFKITL
jgi:hypothetical protein